MRVLAGFFLAAVLALSAAAADVPLLAMPHAKALVVEATLNNRFTGRFLVDTGATYCAVSKEVARKAKVQGRVGGERVRLMTANGPVEAVLGEVRKVEAGRAAARDVAVAVWDGDPVPGLDGILGLSFLGQFTYTVDERSGVLRLKR